MVRLTITRWEGWKRYITFSDKADFNQVGLAGKSYQIQPITMVRLTINRWEVWERVIRFSL